MKQPGSPLPERVQSVDVFRGVTMFLLAGEASHLYSTLRHSGYPALIAIGDQLEHHEWHGLHFWDLIQPFFMFIAGVSIPFAVANRVNKGVSRKTITLHAFKRAALLLFLGWALYFIPADGILVFRLQNVLAQLSVTYLVAFLIRDKSFVYQVVFSLFILLGIDLAYRFFPVEGFNHPWVNFENLGAWFNNQVEGVSKASEWATLNFVATTAHTIWGVLCGKVLMSGATYADKIKKLLTASVVCLAMGYALDLFSITPIIKKIATSSFVLVSGGFCMLALTLFYYIIDIKKRGSGIGWFFTIVGANSLFIYLFFSLRGAKWVMNIISPFVKLLFYWTGGLTVDILVSLGTWAAMWYLCYWLYERKIFFRI